MGGTHRRKSGGIKREGTRETDFCLNIPVEMRTQRAQKPKSPHGVSPVKRVETGVGELKKTAKGDHPPTQKGEGSEMGQDAAVGAGKTRKKRTTLFNGKGLTNKP